MKRTLALLLLAALGSFAYATVTGNLSPSSLAKNADAITVGRVINLVPLVENGNPWMIATVVTEQTLKGKVAFQIRVRIPGGQHTVHGRTLVTAVEDAPALNTNEKALLFINNTETDLYDLTGLNHGYWRIGTQQGRETIIPSVNPSASPVPLDRFLNDIRQALKEEKTRP